jgi:hypothetical protein
MKHVVCQQNMADRRSAANCRVLRPCKGRWWNYPKGNRFLTDICLPSFLPSFLAWSLLPTLCRFRGYCYTLSHTIRHKHSVELLWTRDRPVAEACTWQQATFTRDIYAPDGIRTRNPSKRAAADPRFRPRGHRDGLIPFLRSVVTSLSFHIVQNNKICIVKLSVTPVYVYEHICSSVRVDSRTHSFIYIHCRFVLLKMTHKITSCVAS